MNLQKTFLALFGKTLIPLLLLFASAAPSANAQSAGVVRGRVADAANSGIAGARVRLENTTSGYRQETTSDDAGSFQFFNVPFNSYVVTASQNGFSDAAKNTVLQSNVPSEIELQLQPSGVRAEVEVTADSISFDNELTRSDYPVDSVSVRNPIGALASRQIENLVLSAPGVVKDGKGVFMRAGRTINRRL